MFKSRRSLLFLSFVLFLSAGCTAKKAPSSLTEADQKFVHTLQKELNLNAVLKTYPHTTWIYIPVPFDLFKIELTDKGPETSGEAKTAPSLRFLKVHFKKKDLDISYDEGPQKTYVKTYGYQNSYSDAYHQAQRVALSAVTRAYADLPRREAPDFFVLVFANTRSGLSTQTLFYLPDLIRAHTDQTFSEEFVKRMIQDPPQGNKQTIGDTTGEHLKTHEITWPEFIARQIQYRIEFNYTRSIFPPSKNTREELLNIVHTVCLFYNFKGVHAVLLHDLNQKKTEQIPFADIEQEIGKKNISGGQVHVITFGK